MQEEREMFLVCDLHGHSRKKNIFMYGCSGKVNDRLKERIFPSLLEKNSDIFSFSDWSFAVQKSKESTFRVVMWKELGITNSFTLESSFCGADYEKYADFHFNTDLLQEVGHKFWETIIDFWDSDQVKVKDVLEQLEIMFPKNLEEDSDEGSNADSDFSGEENKVADGGNTAPVKKKKGKKKAATKKTLKQAKEVGKEKSAPVVVPSEKPDDPKPSEG